MYINLYQMVTLILLFFGEINDSVIKRVLPF